MTTPTSRFAFRLAALLLIALPVHALTVRRVNVNVPFAFTAGTATLPAGQYQLQKNGRSTLLVRNHANEVVATVLAAPLSSPGNESMKVEVVFNRYGSDHFMSEVRAGGHGMGLAIQKTKLEREAEAKQKRYTVSVGANVQP